MKTQNNPALTAFEAVRASKEEAANFFAFKLAHETALSDLRSYALDDQAMADGLNPLIHAKTMADMVRAAPILNRFTACSIFIENLRDALLTIAAKGGAA